jgi:dihydrofolate reductase
VRTLTEEDAMTVIASFSMSLDGFIADPDGNVGPLFDWYRNGDVEVPLPGYGLTFHMTEASARYWTETVPTEEGAPGAFVCGRGIFDYTNGWGGRPPGGHPTFVVTHRPPPQDWPPFEGGAPYTFVHDGVESAIEKATAVARGGDIGVSGASIAQQALNAGLVDDVAIDLVPVFLGKGVRYFDNMDPTIALDGPTRVVEGKRVTHLRYAVLRA